MNLFKFKKIKRFFNFFIVLSISSFIVASPLLTIGKSEQNTLYNSNKQVQQTTNNSVEEKSNNNISSSSNQKQIDLNQFIISPTFAPTIPLQSLQSDVLSFDINDSSIELNNIEDESIKILNNDGIATKKQKQSINFDNSSLFFSTTKIDQYANVKYANKNINLSNMLTNKNLVIAKSYYSNDINVFSPYNESTISIDTSKLNINNTIYPSEFISDLNNFYKKITINFNNVIPQTIKDTKVSITPDDKNGNLILRINPGIGIDKTNNPMDMNEYEFIISGFKQTKADTSSVSWAQTKFVGPFDISNYLDQVADFSNQYMYPAVWSMYWSSTKVQYHIKNFLAQKAISKPSGFSADSIVFINNVVIDNIAGSLTVSFTLSNYVNNKGQQVTELPDESYQPFSITITGFKQLTTYPTTLPNTKELPNDSALFNKVYDSSMNEEITNFVISLIQASPMNFNLDANKKYINVSIKPYSENAYVDVRIVFDGFFEANGQYNSSTTFDETVRITGFKSSILTEINISNLNLGDPNEIAQFGANDDYIKNEIITNNNLIINPSPTFNTADINISNIIFDNSQGTISFTVKLMKYNDNTGQEQTTGFQPLDLVITGFKKVTDYTKFQYTVYSIDDSLATTNDFKTNPQKIIDFMQNYLLNKVQDYSKTYPATVLAIKEDSIVANSEEGTITFIPIIMNYFDSANNFELKTEKKELGQIEINGFRKIGETDVNPNANFNTLGDANVLPSDEFQNNMDNIKKMIIDRTIYLPDNFELSDIDVKPESTFSNIEGSITIYFTYKRWYNSDGVVQETESSLKIVVIRGYRHNTPTSISTKLTISQYDIQASDKVNDLNYLKTLVLNNLINNSVNGTTIDNIQLTNIQYDNLYGTISFNISLNKYYDDDGIAYVGPDFKTWNDLVTIYGFKIIKPTKLPDDHEWKTELIDRSASSVVNDASYLKNEVYNRMFGSIPNNFSIDNNIVISNVTYSNINGTIQFEVNLTNYFDDSGVIQTSLPEPYEVYLSGFRTISPTEINNLVSVVGYSDKLPSEFDKSKIIDIIYNNFTKFYQNLPIQFFNKSSIVVDDAITYINSTGSIEILLSTSVYYDFKGELINDSTRPSPYRRVTINGFKTIGETVINSGVVLPTVGNFSPSDLNEDQIKKIIYDNRSSIFIPIPENSFTIDSITINNPNSITKNNLDGSITLDLSIINYYNSLGNLETTIPKNANRFVIRGFKSTSATYIDSQVTLPSDQVGDLLATQVRSSQLETILSNNINLFVRSAPNDKTTGRVFRITSVDILQNSISNSIGSLIVEITYINYYNSIGKYITSPAKAKVRCFGFKKVSPTEIKSEFYVENKENVLPSSLGLSEITNIIKTNKQTIFSSLPDDTVDDQIVVELLPDSYINSQGQIFVTIKLYNYYDQSCNYISYHPSNVNAKPLTQQLLLTGFMAISPTTIKDRVIVDSNTLTSKFASTILPNELEEYVFENRNEIISSIPENFALDNIIISELIPSNNQGIIIAKIELTKYYDSYSQLSTSGFEPRTIVFDGFLKNSSVTYIEPSLFLQNSSSQSQAPYSVSYSEFLDIVYDNQLVKQFPNGFSRTDLLPGTKDNFIEVNNLDGYITAKVSIKNYYDFQGNIVNDENKPLTQTITIYGFRKIQPTEVISFYESDTFSHKVATDETENELLTVVRNASSQFIDHETNKFNPQTDVVKVKIVEPNNLTGNINALLYINNYYDEKGNIVNVTDPINNLSALKSWDITFSGYKKLSPTHINKFFVANTVSTTIPSSIQVSEIKKIIFDNRKLVFNNLPDSDIIETDFDIDIIDTYNLRGEIDVRIKLYKYISSIGELITKDTGGLTTPIIQNISIKGFKSISPTSSTNEISALDLNANITSSLPTEITKNQVVDFIINYQNRILFNLPTPLTNNNFNTNDIILLTPTNNQGTLDVKFSVRNYYDKSGELITNATNTNMAIFNLQISDLQTKVETSAIDYFQVPNPPANKTPQDLCFDDQYLLGLIFDNQNEIFDSLPPNLTTNDFSISNQSFDNLNGTITLTISLSKYYNRNGNFTIASSTNYKVFELTLGGFVSTTTTLFSSQITLNNVSNIVPSEFYKNNADMRQVIYDNRSMIFSNLTNLTSFTKNSIIIKNVAAYDSSGKIIINYSINNYYDKVGILTTQNSDEKILTITGFMSNPITFIYDNPSINWPNQKPSEFFANSNFPNSKEEAIKELVFDKKTIFFKNLPNDFVKDNIIITNVSLNDKLGQIKFSLSINNYFNENGELQKTPSVPKEILLSGFAKQPPTAIGNFNVVLSKNGGTIYAPIGNDYQTVNEFLNVPDPVEQIKSLIISSIVYSNDTTSNKGVLGFESYNVDNDSGFIVVNQLRITNFFDAESSLLISTPDGVSFTFVIRGFKTLSDHNISTPEIIIYTAIGVASAVILAVVGFFIYRLIRHKYYKI